MMKSFKQTIPQELRSRYHFLLEYSLTIQEEMNISISKLKRQFFRPQIPRLEDGKVNLHLGCGSINHPSFINIDGLPLPHVHYVRSIDNLSPFKDESVDLIYACHCLEHFPHAKVPNVLSEWFRVLKKEGICRISVPDFDLLLKIYQDNDNEIDSILPPLMGGQDYKFNFHMTTFNEASLKRLLKSAGFKEVEEWHPNSCELTRFNDFSDCLLRFNGKDYPVSINLQAVK